MLVRPAERLDDETLAAVQAVGQVLLVAGLEMLRVQRRDGRRCCGTNTETSISLQSPYSSLTCLVYLIQNGTQQLIHQTIPQATPPVALPSPTYP